jgi:hypothetical protein
LKLSSPKFKFTGQVEVNVAVINPPTKLFVGNELFDLNPQILIKLMNRNIPENLLNLLQCWYANCWTSIKWNVETSQCLKINFGVRQGSVLSPTLFAIYVNDIVSQLPFGQHYAIILYADDILLLAPSVTELPSLLCKCEAELTWLDMTINVKKSCCIRIGPRCTFSSANVTTVDGRCIPWVNELRYLGVYIVRSQSFKCSITNAKKAFFSASNAIMGKVGRLASEEVVLTLFRSKCLPILLYGLEAFPLTKSLMLSLDFTVNRFFMKLFKTSSLEIVSYCQEMFNFVKPSVLLPIRSSKLKLMMDSDERLV